MPPRGWRVCQRQPLEAVEAADGDESIDGELDQCGCASCAAAPAMIGDERERRPGASTAASTISNRRIRRASYALPRISSS